MNKLRSILLILLVFSNFVLGNAQSELSGSVSDKTTKSSLSNAELIINSSIATTTDNNGIYTLKNRKEKFIELTIFHDNYNLFDTIIQLKPGLNNIDFSLTPLAIELTEIEVKSRRKELFAMRKMNDVEGTTINAGKKTEVVILENISANLASNQSRQIYAQVAGLNIYEGSDGGLQLAIGGRGLDPNRTSNFNTRQNGYDISADVLGYPESYYTPPAHAIREIQIIRGASSLQYGTQFGGLINFKLNTLQSDKKWGVKSSQSIGSFGLFDSYNQIGFNQKKWTVNAYYNFKKGDGYRLNSEYQLHNFFGSIAYKLNNKITLSGEVSYFNYLAKQAGGLTDQQFEANPRLSTRNRNWFDVDWRLINLKYEQQLSSSSRLSLSLFGLNAGRKSIGYRGNPNNLNENPILSLDEQDTNGNFLNPRDLILGTFKNYGAEFRWINEFSIGQNKSILLTGIKWYDANNTSVQGPGSYESDANFTLRTSETPDYASQSDFKFPNHNLAFFSENIFYLNKKWSITPGFRMEYINTGAKGNYNQVVFDIAGNPISNTTFTENKNLDRRFVLFGLGIEHKKNKAFNFFVNASQNYRSVTFSDIRVVSPSFIVDPDIKDENGLTFDLGIRGQFNRSLTYSLNTFGVQYQDRIGIIFDNRANRVRTNIGDAFIAGVETFLELDLLNLDKQSQNRKKIHLKTFVNFAYTQSEYLASKTQNVVGNKVEFIPQINLKAGVRFQLKNFTSSFQYTYLSDQFTDAQNSPIAQQGDLRNGIVGEIPAYGVADLSLSYSFKNFKLNTGINNLLDEAYFTRRATGYPGPGIIPSEGRGWYLGIEVLLND